ncbi:major facilitator superfamily domain-containing protein [Melanogaster broomeanus]|nr:major facilitator superfamily domain-containing protein [Melanogaster broomeanus]
MSKESVGDVILPGLSYPPSTVEDTENKILYVEFEYEDRRNPNNYSRTKKWVITLTASAFTGITAAAISSYSISTTSMVQELHCTELQVTLGLGIYAVGFGVVPLVTSSFSEEVGRRPVYIFSSVMFTLTQVMLALAPNIEVVIVGRALGGIFGSSGATLVGGSIADIWKPEERGLPMSIFAFASSFSIGLGSVIGGLIESSPHLGWRWVQWIHVIVSCLFVVLLIVVMRETRSSIILTEIARSKRKVTGESRHKCRAEINKESLGSLIKTACSRPLYFLLTEPLVQSFSVWCGFTWGVVYCLLESVTPMFVTVYGFDIRQTGFVYATLSVGACIGFLANIYQDKLYRMYYTRKQQEARLYAACVAALCLPVGMLIFAWTASPKIHWIAPIIGLTVFMSGVMVIFQVAFLYLADCYNTYASSAQAGQTLFRNVMALVFPLFTTQMFATLSYKWGLTLFAILAFVMAPTPFVFFFYGSKIRARSIASRRILAADAAEASRALRPGLEKV